MSSTFIEEHGIHFLFGGITFFISYKGFNQPLIKSLFFGSVVATADYVRKHGINALFTGAGLTKATIEIAPSQSKSLYLNGIYAGPVAAPQAKPKIETLKEKRVRESDEEFFRF